MNLVKSSAIMRRIRNSSEVIISFSRITPETSSCLAAQFGILSGFLIILLFRFKFDYVKCERENRKKVQWPHMNIQRDHILKLLSPLIMIFLLPIFFFISTFGGIHKLVSWIIIMSTRPNFVAMMSSFDRIWAIEDDETKSIINAVGLVEAHSCSELVSDMKQCMQRIYDGKEQSTMKLFFRRGFSYGYHYWEQSKDVDLDEHIKSFQCLHSTEIIKDRASLEKTVAGHCNDEMPHDNTALWQIMICQQYVIKRLNKDTSPKKYFPLIFRIHHSLGDGVALVTLLRGMQDDTSLESKGKAITVPRKYTKTNATRTIVIDIINTIYVLIEFAVVCLRILLELPACLVAQFLRPVDVNLFHGPILTGEKVASWIHDAEVIENILEAIKRIKNRIPELKFSDVLMTAVSAGFRDMFEKTESDSEPTFITTVVPGRFCHDFDPDEIRLKNQFSVALLEVPLTADKDAHSRLLRVQLCNQVLETSSTLLVNFTFLCCASYLLPERILRPLLYSRHATAVISNMPGPPAVDICEGHRLEELVFLVPSKGTTGIGISAFTYGGRLRLGAVADAGVAGRRQLQVLLQGMLRELAKLDAITSRSTHRTKLTS